MNEMDVRTSHAIVEVTLTLLLECRTVKEGLL